MANNIDTNLVSEILAQRALTVLANKLTPLAGFSTDFGDQVVAPKSTVKVPLVSATGVLTDPTNYEQSQTTATSIPVAMEILSRPFEIDNQSLNKGMRLENMAQANMDALASGILYKTFSVFKASNGFAISAVEPTGPTDFDASDLKQMWGEVKNGPKTAILDTSYFANILPTDLRAFTPETDKSGYGFAVLDDVSPAEFDDAEVDLIGIACHPKAVAVATALPEVGMVQNDLLSYSTVTEPNLGITFGVAIWISRATRAVWGSFDIAFGVAPGDTGAGVLVKENAP